MLRGAMRQSDVTVGGRDLRLRPHHRRHPRPRPAAARLPAALSSARAAWRLGFDKVRFTQLLRDGGLGLGEAVTSLTGRLLADKEVRLNSLSAWPRRLGAACRPAPTSACTTSGFTRTPLAST